jgi:hypothetical protein
MPSEVMLNNRKSAIFSHPLAAHKLEQVPRAESDRAAEPIVGQRAPVAQAVDGVHARFEKARLARRIPKQQGAVLPLPQRGVRRRRFAVADLPILEWPTVLMHEVEEQRLSRGMGCVMAFRRVRNRVAVLKVEEVAISNITKCSGYELRLGFEGSVTSAS